MIEFVSGDMFDKSYHIRINTVNCVGVMGKGVALAFKTRYPKMFAEYKRMCDEGHLRPGLLHVWHDGSGNGNPDEWIVNFPTKDHWRNDSKYEYVESGLKALRLYLAPCGPLRVAMPALGCGNGNLDWGKVATMFFDELHGLDALIDVYGPVPLQTTENGYRAVVER